MSQVYRCLFKFEISPKGAQKILLEQLFVGPELMLELLKEEKSDPINSSEIRLFLLKNKVALYPYICEDLHNNVEILIDITHKLIKSKDESIRLDFINNCSISKDNKLFFPVKKMGLIEPADTAVFREWKDETRGRRYSEAFSIVKVNGQLLVEIKLEVGKINAKVQELNTKTTSVKECYTEKDKVYDPAMSFSERKIASAVNIANSFKRAKPEFNLDQSSMGSVWAVSGGLPGLGKSR